MKEYNCCSFIITVIQDRITVFSCHERTVKIKHHLIGPHTQVHVLGSWELLYPAIFWDLLLWYSSSSTVHTAPFTFSTRTKHLCRLRLWRTAFWVRVTETVLLKRVGRDARAANRLVNYSAHLPGGGVPPEIRERPGEPVVDLVEC